MSCALGGAGAEGDDFFDGVGLLFAQADGFFDGELVEGVHGVFYVGGFDGGLGAVYAGFDLSDLVSNFLTYCKDAGVH